MLTAQALRPLGDQTDLLHPGRRLKSNNTGGTVYSTITASSYSDPNTTITVANDSSALDSGLDSFSYGIISKNNPSFLVARNSDTQASTSGRSIAWTDIPDWVTSIKLTYASVSTNGSTDILRVRIGPSGGYATTGYSGSVRNTTGGVVNNFSAGFDLITITAAAAVWHGVVTLTRHGTDGHEWLASWQMTRSDSGAAHDGTGYVDLGGQLDRIAAIISGSTDDYDAGSIGVWYQ